MAEPTLSLIWKPCQCGHGFLKATGVRKIATGLKEHDCTARCGHRTWTQDFWPLTQNNLQARRDLCDRGWCFICGKPRETREVGAHPCHSDCLTSTSLSQYESRARDVMLGKIHRLELEKPVIKKPPPEAKINPLEPVAGKDICLVCRKKPKKSIDLLKFEKYRPYCSLVCKSADSGSRQSSPPLSSGDHGGFPIS